MSSFNVHIATNNAAFKDDHGEDDRRAERVEVARLLRQVADQLDDTSIGVMRLRDINGHRVGFATNLDPAEVPA